MRKKNKFKDENEKEENNNEENSESTPSENNKKKENSSPNIVVTPSVDNSYNLNTCAHIPTRKLPDNDDASPWQVSSIEEVKGLEFIVNDKDRLIRITKNMLIRIYPKGMRMRSSNYNPLFYWSVGCQLVALNYQTSGFPVWLNEGRFMRAGHTGYVLKPDRLRTQEIKESKEKEKLKKKIK